MSGSHLAIVGQEPLKRLNKDNSTAFSSAKVAPTLSSIAKVASSRRLRNRALSEDEFRVSILSHLDDNQIELEAKFDPSLSSHEGSAVVIPPQMELMTSASTVGASLHHKPHQPRRPLFHFLHIHRRKRSNFCCLRGGADRSKKAIRSGAIPPHTSNEALPPYPYGQLSSHTVVTPNVPLATPSEPMLTKVSSNPRRMGLKSSSMSSLKKSRHDAGGKPPRASRSLRSVTSSEGSKSRTKELRRARSGLEKDDASRRNSWETKKVQFATEIALATKAEIVAVESKSILKRPLDRVRPPKIDCSNFEDPSELSMPFVDINDKDESPLTVEDDDSTERISWEALLRDLRKGRRRSHNLALSADDFATAIIPQLIAIDDE